MDNTQIIAALILIGLIVLYVYLKKTGHKEENLPAVSQSNQPAVSEDVNLPAVSQAKPPAINDELDNRGPQ